MQVNIRQAKNQLSKLLQRVVLGQEVVIAKAGRPVAKLIPFTSEPRKRVIGTAKLEFSVPDDFDDPLPREIQDAFYK